MRVGADGNSMRCLIILVLLLAGCAGQLHSVTGEEVAAPQGFIFYCQTYPSRVECGGDR